MKRIVILVVGWIFACGGILDCVGVLKSSVSAQELFPDGKPISEWFYSTEPLTLSDSLKRYTLTDYGVKRDSTLVQTAQIQAVIDLAARGGGGVVVIPEGVYMSGALFLKEGVHLHLEQGSKLKGSDNIADFPVVQSRIEGESRRYFAALINADSVDGFSITGCGTIDGNGERYWRAFWLRREWNPQCTNLDEQRPRLLYISNSKDVRVEGVTLQNSPFWSCHIYHSERVKILNTRIYAPYEPVKAPSSDAIDLDVCRQVLVKGCYLSVNDDAIALKGGKGPWADQAPENGSNSEIIIEDCTFGYCHSCLTCGSESIHNRNILMRRISVDRADRLLWLKMRPDTPQNYEYITLEDINGSVGSFLYIHPWRQFFDLKGREDIPLSYANHIALRRCDIECVKLFNVERHDEQYLLRDFLFEELKIRAQDSSCQRDAVSGFEWKSVEIFAD